MYVGEIEPKTSPSANFTKLLHKNGKIYFAKPLFLLRENTTLTLFPLNSKIGLTSITLWGQFFLHKL